MRSGSVVERKEGCLEEGLGGWKVDERLEWRS